MIATEDFVKRLEQIFEFYELTPSSFADKIGVQRSSLSHLLSGRNKPSLDLILKIIAVFNEVDLYWILLGEGEIGKKTIRETKSPTLLENNSEKLIDEKNVASANDKNAKHTNDTINLQRVDSNLEIKNIIIFYTNGTFKNFNS